MTSRSGKRTPSRKSQAIQAVVIGAMLLAAWLIWRRGEPERVPGVAIGSTMPGVELAHGTLYRPVYRNPMAQSGPRIVWRTKQGREQVLVDDDARYAFANTMNTISITGGEVFYGLKPYHPGPGGQGMGGMGGSGGTVGSFAVTATRFLGTFAASASGATPGAKTVSKRTTIPSAKVSPEPILFRRVPVAGGATRDAAIVRSQHLALVGSHVFWNRAGPETRVEMRLGNEMWTEVTGKSDLMVTDLMTGAERPIGSSLQANTNWTVGRDGVFWTAPRPFPDLETDLFYANADNGKVVRFGLPVANPNGIGWSLEFKGSLYWFMHNGPHRDTLMAANLDGTNVRTVVQLELFQLDALYGQNLGAHRDSLYCLVRNTIKDPTHPPGIKLARLHLGRRNPLEILRTLPSDTGQIAFEDGFFYYSLAEPQRGLWETLTDDNLNARLAVAAYRVPLP